MGKWSSSWPTLPGHSGKSPAWQAWPASGGWSGKSGKAKKWASSWGRGTYTVCQCGAWAYDDKKKAFCPNCGKASTCGAAGGKPQHDTSEKEDTKEDKQLLQQAKALVQSLLPKLDDAQRIELQNKLPPELLPPSLSGHDLYKQAAKGNKEANIKLREAYQKKQDLLAKREKLQQQLATVEEQLEAIQGQVEKAEVEDQQATQNLAKVAKELFEAAGQGHGTAKEADTEEGKTGEGE